MAYKEISEVNTSAGVHTILQYVSEIEPFFFPLVLFSLFIVSTVGTFFAQKEFTGRGNFKASLLAGSFFVTIVAYVMNLIPGLINTLTLVVCFLMLIVSALLLFLSKDK